MIRQTIRISTQTNEMTQQIKCVQGDSGRTLVCVLTDYTIPTTTVARVVAVKPSGLSIYNDCTIEGNNVIVDVTMQMLGEIGNVTCQVELWYDGEKITSFEFVLDVAKTLVGTDITTSSEFLALQNSLSKVDLANNRIDNLIAGSSLDATAEVVDARVGWDGTTYDTLGDGIRIHGIAFNKYKEYVTSKISKKDNNLLHVINGLAGVHPLNNTEYYMSRDSMYPVEFAMVEDSIVYMGTLNETDYLGYSCTDYIPVVQDAVYTCYGCPQQVGALYDASYNLLQYFLAYTKTSSGVASSSVQSIVVTNPKAAYARFNFGRAFPRQERKVYKRPFGTFSLLNSKYEKNITQDSIEGNLVTNDVLLSKKIIDYSTYADDLDFFTTGIIYSHYRQLKTNFSGIKGAVYYSNEQVCKTIDDVTEIDGVYYFFVVGDNVRISLPKTYLSSGCYIKRAEKIFVGTLENQLPLSSLNNKDISKIYYPLMVAGAVPGTSSTGVTIGRFITKNKLSLKKGDIVNVNPKMDGIVNIAITKWENGEISSQSQWRTNNYTVSSDGLYDVNCMHANGTNESDSPILSSDELVNVIYVEKAQYEDNDAVLFKDYAATTKLFSGKKLMFTGDSIVESGVFPGINWVDMVRNRYNFDAVYNDGKGGTGVISDYGSKVSMLDRCTTWVNDYGDFDYIIVSGNMNDSKTSGFSLGSFGDNANPNESQFSAIDTFLNKLFQLYPLKQVLWVISTPRRKSYADSSYVGTIAYNPNLSTTYGWGVTSWFEPYCDAIKQVCAHYGVPVLDLYHASGLRPWDDEFNDEYFNNSDGVHPKENGHKIMATKFFRFIEENLTP